MKKTKHMPICLFSEQVELNGTLKAKGNVHLSGEFQGIIETDGSVHIGEKTVAKADIKAESVSVRGKVEGMIEAKKAITIQESGSFTGTTKAETLLVDKTAYFSGKSILLSEEEDKGEPTT